MIISTVNQKGGTGKTTTTVNLGRALAALGKSVLLIDIDTQGSLSYSLGITEPEQTLANVLLGQLPLSAVLVDREGMKVAPSDVHLADAELSLTDMQNREGVLGSILQRAPAYDFVLIDCPPSLSLLTVNALSASDAVIIPMLMEVLSLQGLELITNTIDQIKESLNEKLKVLGILPVMVDRRRKLSSEVYDYIKEHYDLKIFQTAIRPNVRASEAPSFGQSVITYAPESNSAKDYQSLATELLTIV